MTLLLTAQKAAVLTALRREVLWDLARSGEIRAFHPYPTGRRWKYLACDLCRLIGQTMDWQPVDALPDLVPTLQARQLLGLTRREWRSIVAFKIINPINNHERTYVRKADLIQITGRPIPAPLPRGARTKPDPARSTK